MTDTTSAAARAATNQRGYRPGDSHAARELRRTLRASENARLAVNQIGLAWYDRVQAHADDPARRRRDDKFASIRAERDPLRRAEMIKATANRMAATDQEYNFQIGENRWYLLQAQTYAVARLTEQNEEIIRLLGDIELMVRTVVGAAIAGPEKR